MHTNTINSSYENNVKPFSKPEAVPANQYDQVNKFDLAQWNRIMEDIAKPDLAEAIILAMDQRDALKALFPSIYVRAQQTRIAYERKKEIRAQRIALVKSLSAKVSVFVRLVTVRVVVCIAYVAKPAQQRLF